MTSPSRRRETDVMKLLMSDWKVEMADDSMAEFCVEFPGPPESPYAGGVWKVHVELPEAYPYKSPSVGFVNKIYHPNVDEGGGSVCLDVINQTWSPMFDLVNVFEVFLPQLLLYPNPTDPLNGEAAALLMRDPEAYGRKVRDYVSRFATPAALAALTARSGGAAANGGAHEGNGRGGDDSSDDGADGYVSSDADDGAGDMDDV